MKGGNMAKVKTKMYLHSDKDSNYETGGELKLKGEALRNFAYALYEVEFELEVDTKTGEYKILNTSISKENECGHILISY